MKYIIVKGVSEKQLEERVEEYLKVKGCRPLGGLVVVQKQRVPEYLQTLIQAE